MTRNTRTRCRRYTIGSWCRQVTHKFEGRRSPIGNPKAGRRPKSEAPRLNELVESVARINWDCGALRGFQRGREGGSEGALYGAAVSDGARVAFERGAGGDADARWVSVAGDVEWFGALRRTGPANGRL